MLRIIASRDTAAVVALLTPPMTRDRTVADAAARIVRRVRTGGDEALRMYARRFDRFSGPFEIAADEIASGAADAPGAVMAALKTAARNIEKVARRQLPRPWTVDVVPGVEVEQRVTPLERVGCYVPAGRFPLPSTLLMTAVPARVAGVKEVIVCCPRPDAVVFAAAMVAGVSRMFRIGGAHAIGALAYGTATVPAVEKIVGPGNAYVAAAKRLVSIDCPIDIQAGPTELAVLATKGPAEWIAADLIAQSEHDPDARAVLITPDGRLAAAVARAVESQLGGRDIARQALQRNGGAVVARNLDEGISLINAMAAEHVVCDREDAARRITRAGSLFVGRYTAQAAGDYATGSNHVLPTAGAARFRGGLSAADFVRCTTVQRVTRKGLGRVGPAAVTLAEAEGLTGHAASIRIRLNAESGRRSLSRGPRRAF